MNKITELEQIDIDGIYRLFNVCEELTAVRDTLRINTPHWFFVNSAIIAMLICFEGIKLSLQETVKITNDISIIRNDLIDLRDTIICPWIYPRIEKAIDAINKMIGMDKKNKHIH